MVETTEEQQRASDRADELLDREQDRILNRENILNIIDLHIQGKSVEEILFSLGLPYEPYTE